jgi:hypothetical protein
MCRITGAGRRVSALTPAALQDYNRLTRVSRRKRGGKRQFIANFAFFASTIQGFHAALVVQPWVPLAGGSDLAVVPV